MKNKIFDTFDAAVADIPNGVTVLFPGFGGVGVPRNLIAALRRHGAKELTGVSNNAGQMGSTTDVGILVEAGQMKKMICAFTAATHPSQVTPFVRMYNNDEIDAELVPQGTLAERLRAAGSGIGGFYTPTSVGHRVGGGQGAPGDKRADARAGAPPARRLRLRPGLEVPTLSATFNSVSPNATSTWSWAWPGRLPS